MTWRRAWKAARHLIAVVARFDDRPCGDMGDAARGTVDAQRPVSIVALLDVEHGQVLCVLSPVLYVPGHRVAAAVHLKVQDVQTCTSSTSVLPQQTLAQRHDCMVGIRIKAEDAEQLRMCECREKGLPQQQQQQQLGMSACMEAVMGETIMTHRSGPR